MEATFAICLSYLSCGDLLSIIKSDVKYHIIKRFSSIGFVVKADKWISIMS